ncbi:Serine/threonine protein kinase [Asanoa hainanensis]|uniref:non-specific serine/threonine protein kinase n=1 Tax=Asanoa hainanensis TaxID=560556 RepID=A0A239PBI8_9ACTN|nr:serine/threonine-protein kinase [Asanoa hainanensis]SNT64034.1 Serine/threonine protein kinase [Asanoa hainanensis]
MTAETVLAGRYVLDEVIGTGGMGRVWRAHDPVLGRAVAVKEVLAQPWLGADRWQQTLREARAASRLRHPNVVAILDVIQTDRPWIVMEYVPGRSLHEVVAERGPFDPDETARLGLEILSALDAAHRAGILHRDVKPQNILLADDGRVVLTDFGLAVAAEGGVTIPKQVLGSPDFVAPEFARTGASTVECDLWSLGATLYALVEGAAPYHRPSVVATLTALAAGPPDPLRRAGPLAPVILRLLDRDPGRRPNAVETRQSLEAVADGEPPRRAPAPGSRGRLARVGRRLAGQHRWRVVLAAAGALTLASVGTAAAVALPADEPAPGPPPVHACLNAAPQPGATAPSGGTGAFALPPGWRWHTDQTGFTVAVPATWTRFQAGDAVCFRDAIGVRTLAIDPAVTPTADPADLWRQAEPDVAGRPAYTRLRIGPVRAAEGGAEWEFTWSGKHARRVTVTTDAGRAYALSWFTDDKAWPRDQELFRLVLSSYRGVS